MTSATIRQILRSRTTATPDEPFVKCGDAWMTFRELDEASDRAAAGLASLGVTKGDRIGFFLSTSEELIVLFFACFKVGGVFVPLNIYLKGQFLDYQLRDSGVSARMPPSCPAPSPYPAMCGDPGSSLQSCTPRGRRERRRAACFPRATWCSSRRPSEREAGRSRVTGSSRRTRCFTSAVSAPC
jgi:hypothetical protein